MTLRATVKSHPLIAGGLVVSFGLALAFLIGRRGSSGSSAPEGGADPPSVVPVSVTTIVETTLYGYVDSWGTVAPQPSTPGAAPASARVATPVAGIVAQVRTSEGARVSRGQILFSLDSRIADIAVSRARQAVQYAEQTFGRQQQLLASGITSQKQFQEAAQSLAAVKNELAAAETQRGLLDIRAPVAGTVTKVSAKPGDAVDPASGLAEIIDLSRLVVNTGIHSGDIARVRIGQPATLTVDSVTASASVRPSDSVAARVAYVGAQIESGTDQVLVRVSVPPGAGFRPGHYLRVRIAVEERRKRLAVPVESIVTRDSIAMIAVVDSDRAVMRPVQVGLRDRNLVEVSAPGLKPGLTVATTGAYGLPPESRIRIIRP